MDDSLEIFLKLLGLLLLIILITKSYYGEPLNITNYTYEDFNKDQANAVGNASIVMDKIDKVMNRLMSVYKEQLGAEIR
ncbi:MAG: hypothetical protein KKD48_01595 [Nanoarchaeota archaeon]|nr:hypothetical protein [Nanoarchaeota archaeon]